MLQKQNQVIFLYISIHKQMEYILFFMPSNSVNSVMSVSLLFFLSKIRARTHHS